MSLASSSAPASRRRSRDVLLIAAIVVAFLILATTYSVTTPVFEAPDEIEHFFFVKQLADGGGLPIQPEAPPWSAWGQEGSQPPLYYAIASLVIAPLDTADASDLLWVNEHANLGDPLRLDNKNYLVHTDRESWPFRGAVLAVHSVRCLSILFGANTIVVIYVLVRTLLPKRSHLAIAAAALTAFTPQFLFINSAVSNDSLITLLSTLAAWLVIAITRDRWSRGLLVWLGAVLGLAALTKLSGLALWPIAMIAIAVPRWRVASRRRLVADLFVVLAMAAVIAGWWYVRNLVLYGDPSGLNRMLAVVGERGSRLSWRELLGQFEGLRISYWALFGWFNLPLPQPIYWVLDGLALLALCGLSLGFLSKGLGFTVEERWWLLLPMAWIAVMLVSLARWTSITPGTQGRLLFPAAWALNLLLVLGWSQLGRGRWQNWAVGAPLVGVVLLAVISPFAVIRPAYSLPQVISPDEVPASSSLEPVRHGEFVQCIGSEISPADARPGDTVWVTLFWKTEESLSDDFTVFVHLIDSNSRSIAEANSWPGLGNYPTRLWRPGDVIVDRYPVVIPGNISAPLLLRVDVGMFRWSDGLQLVSYDLAGTPMPNLVGQVRVLPADSELAAKTSKTLARFGEQIDLIGSKLVPESPVAAGATLRVELSWTAISRPVEDYTVFVHLLTDDGSKVAQQDGRPRGGDWPTSAWEVGETVLDPHDLRIPESTPSGRYGVWVGLYRWDDGTRLPAIGADGETPSDAIHIADVVVSGD